MDLRVYGVAVGHSISGRHRGRSPDSRPCVCPLPTRPSPGGLRQVPFPSRQSEDVLGQMATRSPGQWHPGTLPPGGVPADSPEHDVMVTSWFPLSAQSITVRWDAGGTQPGVGASEQSCCPGCGDRSPPRGLQPRASVHLPAAGWPPVLCRPGPQGGGCIPHVPHECPLPGPAVGGGECGGQGWQGGVHFLHSPLHV